MTRVSAMLHEKIIAGVILVLVGIALTITGYNNTKPTGIETAILAIEEISKQEAPDSFKHDKTEGYIFMAGGGVAFFSGLTLILSSRKRE